MTGRLLARSRGAPLWLAAAALIALSVAWGRAYQGDEPRIFLGAAPLVGRDPADGWDWRFGWGLVGAALVAATLVASSATGWWWRVREWKVVVASSVGAGAFAVLLALTDGSDGLLHGATHRTEYLANLPIAPPAAEFVRTFTERIDDYSVHVRGHPPGFVLILKALDATGLSGGWSTALLSVAATVAVPAAVLCAVRATAGPFWARRVAPVLVVAPYALWMVTSADAVFTAVGVWAVAATAVGLRSTGWRALVAGLAAGVLLGGLLFLTYGGVTFLLVPVVLVVAAWRRGEPGAARSVVGLGVAAVLVVAAAFAVAGFWWVAGAAATRIEYWEGTAQHRSWAYFAIANLAVALIALGPLTFAGLIELRDRGVWLLVGGASLALLASHLSQYTRAEVERIWLLFYPWIAVAGAAVLTSRRRAAAWIGVQAACAIALQAALVSKW